MSTYNFDSNKIKIYPTTTRDITIDPNSRLNLEENIVTTNTNIVDYSSYVVSGLEITNITISTEGYLNSFTLNNGILSLGGYSVSISEFNLTKLNFNISSGCYISFLYSTTKVNNRTVLNGQDSNNQYTGIKIDINSTLPTGNYFTFAYISKEGNVEYNIKGLNNTTKFDANKSSIQINKDWGLAATGEDITAGQSDLISTTTTYNTLDWLNNHFIVDDGDFSI